jgi:sugar lactone lactonase YvrE
MKKWVTFVVALGAARQPLPAQPPIITNQPASRAVWIGCNVAFTVGVTGAGPFSYQWQLNGTNLPNGTITTVAGGPAQLLGDGGPATNANLFIPLGVAVDASGNLIIADSLNNRVRKVGANGIIATVAGSGPGYPDGGFSGDGGAATNAVLNNPASVAVDASGQIFIADAYNARIRKVDTNGIITTVAGTNQAGFSGDGGPATTAELDLPQGVAVDASGNVFIADSINNRIREVSPGGIITTIAGDGAYAFSGDGGAATNAGLNGPYTMVTDAGGNLFISDHINNRIREVDINGIITTFAGVGVGGFSGDGGPATSASLNGPDGVWLDGSGSLLIADWGNYRVRRVDTNGIITTVAGNGISGFAGDGGLAVNAELDLPEALAVDAYGNLFIDDSHNNRIRKVINTIGPALGLNNAMPGNAGAYQVVVTGAGGSVTSSVASLIVATAPLIYGTAVNRDGSVTLSCVSQPGSTNVLLCATNLLTPVIWQPLSTNLAGPVGDWQYTDANATSYAARFYRSVTP